MKLLDELFEVLKKVHINNNLRVFNKLTEGFKELTIEVQELKEQLKEE